MHRRGGTAKLDPKAHYRPTEQWVDHPDEADVRGRPWRYQPPTSTCTDTAQGGDRG